MVKKFNMIFPDFFGFYGQAVFAEFLILLSYKVKRFVNRFLAEFFLRIIIFYGFILGN